MIKKILKFLAYCTIYISCNCQLYCCQLCCVPENCIVINNGCSFNNDIFQNVKKRYENYNLESREINTVVPMVLFRNETDKLFAQFFVAELDSLLKQPCGSLLLKTLNHLQKIFCLINTNIHELSQFDFDFDFEYVDPHIYITFFDSEYGGSCFQCNNIQNSIFKKQLHIDVNLNINKLQFEEQIGFYCKVQALQNVELLSIKDGSQKLFGITGLYKDPIKMLLAHEIIHATHYMKEKIRQFIIRLCGNLTVTSEVKTLVLTQIKTYLDKISDADFSFSGTLNQVKIQNIDQLLKFDWNKNASLDESYSDMLRSQNPESFSTELRQQLLTEGLSSWIELQSNPIDDFGRIVSNLEELITVTGQGISENLIRKEQKLAPRCLYQSKEKRLLCTMDQIQPLLFSGIIDNNEINVYISNCNNYFEVPQLMSGQIFDKEDEIIIQNTIRTDLGINATNTPQHFIQSSISKEEKIKQLKSAREYAKKNQYILAKLYLKNFTGKAYTGTDSELINFIKILCIENKIDCK